MNSFPWNPLMRGRAPAALAPRIALVLAVKIAGLVLLWLLFVRDQRVTVDSHQTAAAFGLTGATPPSPLNSVGDVHGR